MPSSTCAGVICDCNVVCLANDVFLSLPETVDSNFSLLESNQFKVKRMRYTLFDVYSQTFEHHTVYGIATVTDTLCTCIVYDYIIVVPL